MRTRVSAWLRAGQAQIGKLPVIYLDYDFGQSWLGDGYGGHPLWIANYTTAAQPAIPSGWQQTGWKFWQYSDSGSVAGVDGAVDMDHYNGSEADLRAWAPSS
jgi:lysozyme